MFRTVALVLLALVGMAAMPGQAFGQLATGRSGISTEVPMQHVRAFRELTRFGRCYVERKRDRALALIATTPGTPEEAQTFSRLIRREESCLSSGTTMNLSIVYLRGVIAEAFLRSDAGVPESYRLPAPTVAEVRNLGDTARCYTSGHRGEVRGLLATEPGTPEEVAAVQLLWNDFRACLPADAAIRLNATWIRFLLAEALLRLAPQTAVPAPGT
ncbi:MAG: hypothetical protein ACXWU2_14580 [Allosphingosinicella sp.]